MTACDTGDAYEYVIAGTSYSYAKADYQGRLTAMLRGWLADAGIAVDGDATIELWLAVPEANPAAVQGRAVLRTNTVELVWYLSLHPDEWTLADRDIGILDDETYPGAFGHRPRQVLVKARAGAEVACAALLAEHGATDPSPYVTAWSVYRTAAGAELDIARSIRADPRSAALVDRVEMNQIVEWIAVRALAFTFAFSPLSP